MEKIASFLESDLLSTSLDLEILLYRSLVFMCHVGLSNPMLMRHLINTPIFEKFVLGNDIPKSKGRIPSEDVTEARNKEL